MPAIVGSPARQVDVQDPARDFLPEADYADAFRTATTVRRPAHEWARRSLGTGASALDRVFGSLVWHGILGFDLVPIGTPGTLVGWTVSVDEPNWCVLAADGRLMAGRMVFEATPEDVTWTTLLRFRRPPAERVWAVAQHAHRALARRLLARAARSLAS